jgi:hypothetical protein
MSLFTHPVGGARVTIILNINSALTSGYNILANAGGAYVAGYTDFIVNVNADCTHSQAAGITFGALAAGDSVNIIIATGVTVGGGGGAGGQGTHSSNGGVGWIFGAGSQGSPGIDMSGTSASLFITNHGTIACGSGGGGGGGADGETNVTGVGGGGGGSGQNIKNVIAGAGPGGAMAGFSANYNGVAGSGTSGGAGGFDGGLIRGGQGGDGGSAGASAGNNGAAATGGSGHQAPGNGGDYGFIVKNTGGAQVTYVLHGTEIGH